jgi:CrcB protein
LKKYALIGLFGGFGAILRWLIRSHPWEGFRGTLPINTLLINLSGSLLLAFILTAAFRNRKPDADIRLGITTGFLGAFTTFSTYCKEIVSLLSSGDYYTAAIYTVVSLVLGLAAAYTGAYLAGDVLPGSVSGMLPRIAEQDMPTDEEPE